MPLRQSARRTPKAPRTAAPSSHEPNGPFDVSAEEAVSEVFDDFGDADDVTAEPQDGFAALLEHPALQAAIDAAVNARVSALTSGLATPAATAGGQDAGTMQAFIETIRHLIDVQAEQRPGWKKPLSAEQIDRRAAGYTEMKALLQHYEENETPPLWEVGEKGFFECVNALEFTEGQKIRTYLPPAEDFVPKNPEAERVHAAMMQWLGVKTPDIGEQLKNAMLASKQAPMITGTLQPTSKPGLVQVVAEAAPEVKRKRRTMGTIAPERHESSLADRAAGPQGPVFEPSMV